MEAVLNEGLKTRITTQQFTVDVRKRWTQFGYQMFRCKTGCAEPEFASLPLPTSFVAATVKMQCLLLQT